MKRRISKTTTTRARSLRIHMTDAERKLWHTIRQQQLGYRFRRQHPVAKYIIDFACIDQKCAIELDGGQHQDQLTYDQQRTAFLTAQGWRVLRFWNNEVVTNLEGVLATILEHLINSQPPS